MAICVGTLEQSTTSPTASSRRCSGVKRSSRRVGAGKGSGAATGSVKGGEDEDIAVLDRVKTTEYYRTSLPRIFFNGSGTTRSYALIGSGSTVTSSLWPWCGMLRGNG